MDDFKINDHILHNECTSIANEIFEEFKSEHPEDFKCGDAASHEDEMQDRVHEYVDGHEWVIYTYKAHMLCAHCNTDNGEEFLEDIGMPEEPTYNKLGALIAFGEMRSRVDEALRGIIAASDAACDCTDEDYADDHNDDDEA